MKMKLDVEELRELVNSRFIQMRVSPTAIEHVEMLEVKSEQLSENIVQLTAEQRRLEELCRHMLPIEDANKVIEKAVPLVRELTALIGSWNDRGDEWNRLFDQIARAIGDHFGEEGPA